MVLTGSLQSQLQGPQQQKRLLVDLTISLNLFVLAALLASSQANPYLKDWGRSTFYERYFSPAVILACGKGYRQPAHAIPALDDFLQQRRGTFSCEQLPEDLQYRPLSRFQITHQYLLRIVAYIWFFTGVSWNALTPLLGFFCGLVTALSYGIFRLAMGIPLATLGTLLFFPLHLVWLQNFRDYAKAPFILSVFLIFGLLLKKTRPVSILYILSAGIGGIIGIGKGFRSDLLICIPPFFSGDVLSAP